MLDMAVLYNSIPVLLTLMFTQSYSVMGKLELVQSFCYKVEWSNSNVYDGLLCKGDDCAEVWYGEYGLSECLPFLLLADLKWPWCNLVCSWSVWFCWKLKGFCVTQLLFKGHNLSLVIWWGETPETLALHLDAWEPVSFKLCVITVTIRLNSLVLFLTSLTFIQGHSCTRYPDIFQLFILCEMDVCKDVL